MRALSILTVVVSLMLAVSFCKMGGGDMTAQDFLKMEDEVAATDLTPESKDRVAKKYGYTLQQYQTFEERARTDRKLQEELGAIRLKSKQQ